MNKKTALITGSAKGLGKKTAIDLAMKALISQSIIEIVK
ncbi:Uncharacterised protein [Staphylococcus saprophyticus]|nr:Uncharacterised protein [Staphylococcus saprophyticus]